MANKVCPFCKKNVDVNNAICPHCQRVLFEKFSMRSSEDRTERTTQQSESHSSTQDKKGRLNNILSKFIFWKSSTTYRKDGNIYYINQDKTDGYKNIIVTIAIVVFTFGLYFQYRETPSSISVENTSDQNNTTESRKSLEEIFDSPPAKKPSEYNYLSNGRVIDSVSYYLSGDGELKIENGTSDDAVIKLIATSIDESIYTAYIRAENSHIVRGISDGRYKVLFMHGKDWDNNKQTFLINQSYSKFTDTFDYTTREVRRYDGIYEEYSVYEVTLHPVLGGTARTDNISSSEFEKY